MVAIQEELVLLKAWQRLRGAKPTFGGCWLWHGLEACAGGAMELEFLAKRNFSSTFPIPFFSSCCLIRCFFKCFLVVQWAKVNGVWSWQAVHAAGGVHVKLPYDCHAGLKNWHIGWSAPKKAWKGCGNDFRAFVCCINIEFATLPLVFCVGLHRPGAAATISWAVKVEQAQMLMPWHFGQKLGH